VFFHTHDADDGLQNRGIGQLRLEIDLAVVEAGPDTGNAPPLTVPPAPALSLDDLGGPADGARIPVAVRVALSGAGTTLARALVWRDPPACTLAPPAPAIGQGFAVVVSDSRATLVYTLVDGDAVLAGPLPGDGGALRLEVPARAESAAYALLAAPAADDPTALPLTHRLHLALPLPAAPDDVPTARPTDAPTGAPSSPTTGETADVTAGEPAVPSVQPAASAASGQPAPADAVPTVLVVAPSAGPSAGPSSGPPAATDAQPAAVAEPPAAPPTAAPTPTPTPVPPPAAPAG
jgi:hypothetical protein